MSHLGHLTGEQPYSGDLLTIVINHLRPSWDDPPRSQVAAIQVAVLPPLPSTSSIAAAGAVSPRHRRGRSTARRMAGLLFKMQGQNLTMKNPWNHYPDLPVAKSLQATIMQYLYLLEFVEFTNIYYIPVCIYFPSFIVVAFSPQIFFSAHLLRRWGSWTPQILKVARLSYNL